MQSYPTEEYQTSTSSNSDSTSSTRHYGLHHQDQPFNLLSEYEDERSQVSESLVDETQSLTRDTSTEGSRRGLSCSPPRTRSPVDRIIEHEKASPTSPKRSARGPAFKIVPRTRLLLGEPIQLLDFPNEVLTHILSHLPSQALATISLVSHRLHDLVTTPHAWRLAFSRYFPGANALPRAGGEDVVTDDMEIASGKRAFTRLTPFASWRSEYILRTQLLAALGRGKPAQTKRHSGVPTRNSPGSTTSAQITYSSSLLTTINHLEAVFTTRTGRKLPRFIHGASEIGAVSTSDPENGRADSWGFSDLHSFVQFSERFPGEAEFGLGAGEVVGVPNPMDISPISGLVHGEGSPGGSMYYRSTKEQRGRLLAPTSSRSIWHQGIPAIMPLTESICCTWIAKSLNVPNISNDLIGILGGSSSGTVSAFSLGTNGLGGSRLERGELIARWVLSPGVPIIGLAVDEQLSSSRIEQHRVWAVALNALGEIYHLTAMPSRAAIDRSLLSHTLYLDEVAWETGRTVYWTLVEATRRKARPDPYDVSGVDGSYSPRSSWNGMGLSKEQISAETKEIEQFLKYKPKHFRKVCDGWEMQRRLFVDFAGDDEHGAGEGVIVIECGLMESQTSQIIRYVRSKISKGENRCGSAPSFQIRSSGREPLPSDSSSLTKYPTESAWSFNHISKDESSVGDENPGMAEEWRTSTLLFGGFKYPQIMTAAMDQSAYSVLTTSDDPLLSKPATFNSSSASTSEASQPLLQSDIPGQRARFFAVGTKLGQVLVWDIRAPISSTSELANTIPPIRIIHTASPQISCLGLTALYLVHGGNDGLVQTWDLLASDLQPLRTLNSRFSSRARRRLIHADASMVSVGHHQFAAGAICLDPDPTILRGMVSLGTHLRYWNFSSLTADQHKSNKRRVRRSERGSNQGGDKFHNTGRGFLKDYIATEALELERERISRRKEEERLAGRFGVDILGPDATEEEMMAYATLLSEEAARSDDARRRSGSEARNDPIIDAASSPLREAKDEDQLDADIAEAIRLSLCAVDPTVSSLSGPAGSVDFSVRHARKGRHPTPKSPPLISGQSDSAELDELELALALQLSLADEDMNGGLLEEFPTLSKQSSLESGKGKRRRS